MITSQTAAEIVHRYHGTARCDLLSYATVRDFCDSADHLPQITSGDGDLKNGQRPWGVKALVGTVPPPARLLEVGGGEPGMASFLDEIGYDITVIDPYDGSGRGPVEYETFQLQFPRVKLIREILRPAVKSLAGQQFDAIFSVSVLEHLSPQACDECFAGIKELLKPGGVSLHCFDFILRGHDAAHDRVVAARIIAAQAALASTPAPDIDALVAQAQNDSETFYLSAQGHQWWRCGRSYDEFPFRQVVSLQTIARLT